MTMAEQLVTYKGAQGFYVAPLGDATTALKRRVSPYYDSQQAAERACDEKQREYDAAERRVRNEAASEVNDAWDASIAAGRPDPATSCDTCGQHTGIDTHICGQCAEDWNERDQAAGRRAINRRRAENGLPPLEEG
jgi:hypothetical protein